MARKKKSFEEAVDRLEDLVNELEKGELALDDILKKYRESTDLIKFCRGELENADKEISGLWELNASGEQVPVNIDAGENDNE